VKRAKGDAADGSRLLSRQEQTPTRTAVNLRDPFELLAEVLEAEVDAQTARVLFEQRSRDIEIAGGGGFND
jgi:hypothetical protein